MPGSDLIRGEVTRTRDCKDVASLGWTTRDLVLSPSVQEHRAIKRVSLDWLETGVADDSS
jgi:hypothetical protein